jgi:sulfur-oxidizing protein SoxX
MTNRSKLLLVTAIGAVTAACSHGRYSSAAFHLPPDGDAARGKQAFMSLGCNSCHAVAGVDMPAPTVQPPVPVVLGGEVVHRLSDGYLATSMIHPSYELAPFPAAQITSNGESRMPSYADKMTIRQMTDIVTFLQAHYKVPKESTADVTH